MHLIRRPAWMSTWITKLARPWAQVVGSSGFREVAPELWDHRQHPPLTLVPPSRPRGTDGAAGDEPAGTQPEGASAAHRLGSDLRSTKFPHLRTLGADQAIPAEMTGVGVALTPRHLG